MKTPQYYSTSDFPKVVFLFTVGHKLLKTSILDAKRLIFHFEDNEKIAEDAARFLHGATAPARQLFENYRTLRSLVFEKTNGYRMNGGKV